MANESELMQVRFEKEEKINCKALCNKKNVLNQVSKAQIEK